MLNRRRHRTLNEIHRTTNRRRQEYFIEIQIERRCIMKNLLKFKAMICWETATNKRELVKALKKVIRLAKIAIMSGRIVSIELKEIEDPTLTNKDKVALGLSGTCAGE